MKWSQANSQKKMIQNSNSEDDQGSWKPKGEEAINVFQRSRRTKKQTEMNNILIEIKNTLEGISSRIIEAEEQISDLEDRMVEITAVEQNKEKRMKRHDSLRDLWDDIKYTNICIIGITEEEKENISKKIFEEII